MYLAEVRFAVRILASLDDTGAYLLGRRVSTRAHHRLRLTTLEACKSLELRRQAILTTVRIRQEVLVNLHRVYLVLDEVF